MISSWEAPDDALAVCYASHNDIARGKVRVEAQQRATL